MKKKTTRSRYCRRCKEIFKATGRYSFICEDCNQRPYRGNCVSPILDLRFNYEEEKEEEGSEIV